MLLFWVPSTVESTSHCRRHESHGEWSEDDGRQKSSINSLLSIRMMAKFHLKQRPSCKSCRRSRPEDHCMTLSSWQIMVLIEALTI
jgi:hypothetical protein